MDTPAGSYPPWVRDQRFGGFAAVLVGILIILMIVPEGFDYQLLLSGRSPQSGDLVSRILWAGLLAASSLLLIWRSALTGRLLRQLNPFLIAFGVLAFASILWSVDPGLTLRRDIRFLTMVLVSVAFCLSGWHARRLQNVVRPILTLTLVGSLAFGLVAPSLAIHQDKAPELIGAWRGLTNHKNSLGALAGVTLIFWLHAWSAREVRASRALPGLLIAGLCLWLSRSATSFFATLFAIVFLGLLVKWPPGLRPYLKYAVAIVACAFGVYALAILGLIPGKGLLLAPMSAVTGDASFTGRSGIWWIVAEHMRLNPLLGTGYGAYWAGPTPQSPSYEFIARMGGFYPGSAHNGYLEVANDLGWVGLLLLFGYLASYLRQGLRALSIDRWQGVLLLTLLMQQVIANLSESHWLSVLSVQFVLMTLATTALARLLVDYRLFLRFGAASPPQQVRRSTVAWQTHGRRA